MTFWRLAKDWQQSLISLCGPVNKPLYDTVQGGPLHGAGRPRWAMGPCKALWLSQCPRASRWVKIGIGVGIRKHHLCQPPGRLLLFWPVPRSLDLQRIDLWKGVGGDEKTPEPTLRKRTETVSVAVAGSLVLQTAQSATPICWSRVPSFSWPCCCQEPPPPFSIWRQGERYCGSVNSSCPKA